MSYPSLMLGTIIHDLNRNVVLITCDNYPVIGDNVIFQHSLNTSTKLQWSPLRQTPSGATKIERVSSGQGFIKFGI